MKLGMYSIRDKKIGYGDPIILANDEVAVRAFKQWVNSPNENQANQFIEDKELHKLGTFDTDQGRIEPESRFMITAIELKEYRKESKE